MPEIMGPGFFMFFQDDEIEKGTSGITGRYIPYKDDDDEVIELLTIIARSGVMYKWRRD